jgi:hypothetical protein
LIFQGFFVFVLHFVLHDENHCMNLSNKMHEFFIIIALN